MKSIIANINKAFENKVRLGIMAVLVVNDTVNFNELKELLGVTDGNLASHLKSLESKEYIGYTKTFENRKPRTSYYATKDGKEAFKQHILALEKLLK